MCVGGINLHSFATRTRVTIMTNAWLAALGASGGNATGEGQNKKIIAKSETLKCLSMVSYHSDRFLVSRRTSWLVAIHNVAMGGGWMWKKGVGRLFCNFPPPRVWKQQNGLPYLVVVTGRVSRGRLIMSIEWSSSNSSRNN